MHGAPRCTEHDGRRELPRLCPICQRIAVEWDIVIRTVDVLLAAGFALDTDADPGPATTDRATIMFRLIEVDDERLYCRRPEKDREGWYGWVRFVYGNCGYDVISDYTTNLEAVLKPVNEYADTLAV